MHHEINVSTVVVCDTCGHRYSSQIERCPSCKSNQRSNLMPPKSDLKNRLTPAANSNVHPLRPDLF